MRKGEYHFLHFPSRVRAVKLSLLQLGQSPKDQDGAIRDAPLPLEWRFPVKKWHSESRSWGRFTPSCLWPGDVRVKMGASYWNHRAERGRTQDLRGGVIRASAPAAKENFGQVVFNLPFALHMERWFYLSESEQWRICNCLKSCPKESHNLMGEHCARQMYFLQFTVWVKHTVGTQSISV